MIITDLKRNIVHFNGNAKKNHESLTENTTEEKKILEIKMYSLCYMMCYVRDHHLFVNPKTDLTHNETMHNRF